MLVRFLVPANIRHNSGGNVYNARLTEGLRALGAEVEIVPVDGAWPDADDGERRRFGSQLGTRQSGPGITSRTVVLVDGLIACGAPDELERAAAAGHNPWVLLHMPLPSYADGEGRALRAAAGVICTSSAAAAAVAERHGLPAGPVALPGTDPAPASRGSSPPRIIVVAALLPNKDQLLTVAALARLKDLAWTASFVGSEDADPAYAALVRASIAGQGMEDRVRVTGELAGEALERQWDSANLSLLVSRAESFGLVVTESLARGIPVVVRAGTGAVEALHLADTLAHQPATGANPAPGTAVGLAGPESSRPDVLAAVLRQWFLDPALRTGWRASALAAREDLPGWDSTARNVLDILGGSARSHGTRTLEAPPAVP